MTAALITAGAAIIVALVTFLLTYWSSRRQSAIQAQLTRINLQLAQLYGPLFSLSRTNDAVWDVFFKRYSAEPDAFFGKSELTSERREAWVDWMQLVFMPSNRRIVELIEQRTDLLDDDEMPKALLDFCAHVAGFEVTLKRWQAGDFSSLTSIINHPGEVISAYAEDRFLKLKSKQQRLLRAPG